MSSPPVAVVDALNSLLEAEQGSVFRFMGEGSPYLSRASADVRRPLQEMVQLNHQYVMELAEMIQRLGGEPVPRQIRPEEQYLAFLSLKFLLPKLVDEKDIPWADLAFPSTEAALRHFVADRSAGVELHHVAEMPRRFK